jgi:hypothetical protein
MVNVHDLSESDDAAKVIRKRILKRAQRRCERCFKPNGKEVWILFRDGVQYWMGVEHGRIWRNEFGNYELRHPPHPPPGVEPRVIKVVLSIVHLNPASGNLDVNLKALCQHCHRVHQRQTPQIRVGDTHVDRAVAEAGNGTSLVLLPAPEKWLATTGVVPPPAKGWQPPEVPDGSEFRSCTPCGCFHLYSADGVAWPLSTRSHQIGQPPQVIKAGMRVIVTASGPPPTLVFGTAGAYALVQRMWRYVDIRSLRKETPAPGGFTAKVLDFAMEKPVRRVALILFEYKGQRSKLIVLEVGDSWQDLEHQNLHIIPQSDTLTY